MGYFNKLDVLTNCKIALATNFSLLDENGIAAVKVYPNPNNGNFFVNVDHFENTSVEVFNEKVHSKQMASSNENIGLKKLNAGMYMVQIKQNGSYVYHTNIIIKK